MAWARRFALLWLACLALAAAAAEPIALPPLKGRVTDLTGTLDPTQRGRLEADLAAIERSGKAQVAVLLLPSTEPETIEQFGIRLAEAWKIGRRGADDGLIIIVAKDDRRTRIEVGYGLEGAIPDAIARRIVEERMLPAFRQGDFFGGLRAAVGAIGQALGAQPAAPPVAAAPAAAKADQDWMTWLFFLAAGAGVLRAIFGLLGSLAAAAIGGGLAFFIFGSLAWAVLAAIAVFVLSFFHIGFGGGGGSSSGGGGFSGGGGGFGGGGASGRW